MPASTSQGRSYPPNRPSGQPGVFGPRSDRHYENPLRWVALARVWSPRKTVRVDRDLAHTYANEHDLSDLLPAGVPYALHLTDDRHQYRLIAVDFDAHHGESSAAADSADLSARLHALEIDHVVCASGPAGGMHVWIRLASPVPADYARKLADALAATYRSADVGALRNPTTGCVRPPGAPHRHGGRSIPLGDPDLGETRPALLDQLLDRLEHRRDTPPATSDASTTAVEVLEDAEGAPYLCGPRRPLAPTLRALARRPVEGADASGIAYSLLLGCAHARMTLSNVRHAALTDRWPGLEHIRTAVHDGHRQPRTDPEAHLRRQWGRAVAAASLVKPAVHEGSRRRQEAEAAVATLVAAMDAQPARWMGRTGVQDRLILLALAARMLRACRVEVHLAERAWAVDVAIPRAVLHARVERLRGEGWLCRAARSVGPWAARWTVGEKGGGKVRSGRQFSAHLEKRIHIELRRARHDVWQSPALGVLGMRVWERLRTGWAPVRELARALGITAATVRQKLGVLQAVRLVAGDGRAYRTRARLAAAADALGQTGANGDRARLYELESAAWTWWHTCRYQPDASDAIAEWGEFPSSQHAADTDPRDIALTYGARGRGIPAEATQWGAALVILDTHRHRDPGSWKELVAATRAALPSEDVLVPAYRARPAA